MAVIKGQMFFKTKKTLTFRGITVEKEFDEEYSSASASPSPSESEEPDEELLNSKWPVAPTIPDSFRPSLNGNFAENKMAKSYSPSVSPSNSPSESPSLSPSNNAGYSPTQDANSYLKSLERVNSTGMFYLSNAGPYQPAYSFNEFSNDTVATVKPKNPVLPRVKK